jgi:nitrile hydratase beta subunit
MNSIHDFGGRHGHGPVVAEENEPPFHADWEGRMHGIAVACQIAGINATPEQRKTIEQIPHWKYLLTSYYEKWLDCYETILDDKGVVTRAELEQRIAEQAAGAPARLPTPAAAKADAETMHRIIYNGTPHDRPTNNPPRFKAGDRVRALNRHPLTHIRLPAYVKGKVGVIEEHFGAHCDHEALAYGKGDVPNHLYAVRFEAAELWGPDAENPHDLFYVDLFETYLEEELAA